MPRVIYRIVRTNPPSEFDYLSFAQLGRIAIDAEPDTLRLAEGLSVLATLQDAQKKGKGRPWRGNGFVAEYELPDELSFRLEQTGRDSAHYTLWCDVEALHACLRRVVPIVEDNEHV